MTEKKPFDGVTVKEFPKVGRYRVRIIQSGKNGELGNVLDIREHMESDRFAGFTRRGIRIYAARDAAALEETLKQILEDGMLSTSAPTESK